MTTAPSPAPARVRWAIRDRALLVGGAFAVAVVVAAHRERPVGAAALGVMVGAATVLAAVDAREHRLPNAMVGPLASAVVFGVTLAGVTGGDLARSGRAFGLAAVTMVVFLAGHMAGGVGMGDVKYAFPLAVVVGWYGAPALMVAAMATTVSAAATLAVLAVLRRGWPSGRLAYGPHMTVGLATALLAAG